MADQNKPTKVIIDVDVVIKAYNKNNPGKRKLDRKQLAQKLGVGEQLLSDWKTDRKKSPKWAKHVLTLCELGGMDATEFIHEKQL